MTQTALTRREFLTAIAASTITVQAALIPTLVAERPGELSILLVQRNGNEVTYHGYKRVVAPRNAATWQISDGQAINKILIVFPECNGRHQEITGFGICIDGEPVALGDLTASLHVVPGVIPEFAPGNLPLEIHHIVK